MNTAVFREILEKLVDINYFFISGVSVAIYTQGKRIPGDIDIAIHEIDIDVFAKRLGTFPKKRKIDKGSFVVEDYGFELEYKGQMVECTTGYPQKRSKENTFNKLFEKKVKNTYLDKVVFVEPLEELINQKAYMNREKDIKDLELLRGKVLDVELFIEIGKDKGNLEEVLHVAKKFFPL